MDSEDFNSLMELTFFSQQLGSLVMLKAKGQIDYEITDYVPGSHMDVTIIPRASVAHINIDIDLIKTKEQDQ